MNHNKKIHSKVCFKCKNPYVGYSFQRYCSEECRKYQQESVYADSDLTVTSRGAVTELTLAIALMKDGWHVFRALSPSCPCDLVAMKNDQSLLLESRTAAYNPGTGKVTFSKKPADRCHAYVSYSKNGIGIHPGTLPCDENIFNRLKELVK